MATWKQIQRLYRKDEAILRMISLAIAVSDNEEFFGHSIRNLPLSEDEKLTLLDLVVARQKYLNPELKEEEIRILISLQSKDDFVFMAIDILEELLSDFKSR